MLKNMGPSDLLNMIRQVHAGKKHVPGAVAACIAEHLGDEDLTERETEVLQHVAGGNRNVDIAAQLFIYPKIPCRAFHRLKCVTSVDVDGLRLFFPMRDDTYLL